MFGDSAKSFTRTSPKVKSKQRKISVNNAFNGTWIGILSPYTYGSNKQLFEQLNDTDFEEVKVSGIKHIKFNLITSHDSVRGEVKVDGAIHTGWILDSKVVSNDEIILIIQCEENYKSRIRLKLLGSKNLRGILADGVIFHQYKSLPFYSYLVPYTDAHWLMTPLDEMAPFTKEKVDPGRPQGGRPAGGRHGGGRPDDAITGPGRPGGGRPGGEGDAGRPGGNLY